MQDLIVTPDNMAHLHKKMKNGRPYYYVREMARVNGKPKVTNQVYLGSPERILEMAEGKANLPKKIQAQEFGSLWLANLVEQQVDLAGIIDKVVPNSQMFWEKWEHVSEKHLGAIADTFFRRINKLEPPESDCFMFDTTNYYTFMESKTNSELAQRGKNKKGRNWLRQIGLALLVSRDKRIPFYYKPY